MLNLFKTEMIHYWKWTTGFMVLHLLVLYYLNFLGVNLYKPPQAMLLLLGMMIIALVGGAVQILLRRKPSEWAYLLQRPLSEKRIFLALAAAGCCHILIIALVPGLVMMIMQVGSSPYIIESRHFALLIFNIQPVLIGYFLGCFVAMSPNRLGLFALAGALVFINVYMNSWIAYFAPFMLAASMALAYLAFKADLSRPYRHPVALVLTELPIQFGLLWGLAMLMMIFLELQWAANGSPTRDPRPGTDFYYLQMTPEDKMQAALAASDDPRASFFSQQVTLGEITAVRQRERLSHPQRNQFPVLDSNLLLLDEERGIRWSFSHNTMLFEGRNINSNEAVGWLGSEGFAESRVSAKPFISVPWVTANQFVISDDTLYQVDWNQQAFYTRYVNDQGGRFSDSLGVTENITTLLSEGSVFIFNSRELLDHDIALKPVAEMTLPVDEGQFGNFMHILELIDGYLVIDQFNTSPTTIGADFDLYGRAELRLYYLAPGQETELISSMPLENTLEGVFVYNGLVLAPGMRLLSDLFFGVMLNKQSLARTLPMPFATIPTAVLGLTVLVSLLSTAIVFILIRKTAMPKNIQACWLVMTLFTGMTALVSLLVGYYWRKQDQLQVVEVSHASE
ncbi:MAG: hypothetical protein RQ899_13910 [Pseudomonadales bacterium]|nr:hypothetical protein [Pseudomonadales bacterium]